MLRQLINLSTGKFKIESHVVSFNNLVERIADLENPANIKARYGPPIVGVSLIGFDQKSIIDFLKQEFSPNENIYARGRHEIYTSIFGNQHYFDVINGHFAKYGSKIVEVEAHKCATIKLMDKFI